MLIITVIIFIWCGICQFLASRVVDNEPYLWRNWLFAGYYAFSAIQTKWIHIYFNRFEDKFVPFMLEYDDGFALIIFNVSFYFKKE